MKSESAYRAAHKSIYINFSPNFFAVPKKTNQIYKCNQIIGLQMER